MDYKEIQELIKLVGKTKLSEVKIEQKDFKITIRGKAYSDGKTQVISSNPVVNQMASPMGQPMNVVAPPPAPEPLAQKAPEANPTEQAADTAADNLEPIKSPMIGTFYRSSSPDKPPFVKVGDTIEKGTVICIVEAMKLFNEIEAEVSGKIVKVVAEDASPVEYDSPLFLIEPA